MWFFLAPNLNFIWSQISWTSSYKIYVDWISDRLIRKLSSLTPVITLFFGTCWRKTEFNTCKSLACLLLTLMIPRLCNLQILDNKCFEYMNVKSSDLICYKANKGWYILSCPKGECSGSHLPAISLEYQVSRISHVWFSCLKPIDFTVHLLCRYTINSVPPASVGLPLSVRYSVQYLYTQSGISLLFFIPIQEVQNRNRASLWWSSTHGVSAKWIKSDWFEQFISIPSLRFVFKRDPSAT